ncbi:hypothetical protein HGM15179_009721 [Zosterops borbonicus]|uniref:Uncharacterized protein n=1 Tax=Zosterops borbonicus TaxID=364589 RepID=A0A8K1GFV4_9PASS|nr:hypothetical protein HGM15179_009721 [Zosterops borbonicus]
MSPEFGGKDGHGNVAQGLGTQERAPWFGDKLDMGMGPRVWGQGLDTGMCPKDGHRNVPNGLGTRLDTGMCSMAEDKDGHRDVPQGLGTRLDMGMCSKDGHGDVPQGLGTRLDKGCAPRLDTGMCPMT